MTNMNEQKPGRVIEVVIAGAGPNGLMLAGELGLAGIRPVVLDPMPGPNPQPRANRIVGEAARILDHRGLYSVLTGTAESPKPAPRSMFAGFQLDLSSDSDSQLLRSPFNSGGTVGGFEARKRLVAATGGRDCRLRCSKMASRSGAAFSSDI